MYLFLGWTGLWRPRVLAFYRSATTFQFHGAAKSWTGLRDWTTATYQMHTFFCIKSLLDMMYYLALYINELICYLNWLPMFIYDILFCTFLILWYCHETITPYLCKTQNLGLCSKEEKPRDPINQPSRCNTREGLLSVVQMGDSDLLGGRAPQTANWASFLYAKKKKKHTISILHTGYKVIGHMFVKQSYWHTLRGLWFKLKAILFIQTAPAFVQT